MTVTTTQNMITAVTYGQASGNYDGSSQDWISDAVPAANYYSGNGNIQTIYYNLSSFVGIIIIEATLNDLPDQASWFEISRRGDGTTPITGMTTETVTGNFSWTRARVLGFDGGTITSVYEIY